MNITDIKEAVKIIKGSSKVTVITGAGISAESGISTFRGEGGYWRQHSAYDLASEEGFTKDPRLVWEWYQERREAIKNAQPNKGHEALVELEKYISEVNIITQNVDGLHQRAGSTDVNPIHGNVWELVCKDSGEIWENQETFSDLPPHCKCGALVRPNVLWFGESYSNVLRGKAYRDVKDAEVLLLVGTSGAINIVSDLLWYKSKHQIIEINTEDTDVSSQCGLTLYGKSGDVLPLLLQELV